MRLSKIFDCDSVGIVRDQIEIALARESVIDKLDNNRSIAELEIIKRYSLKTCASRQKLSKMKLVTCEESLFEQSNGVERRNKEIDGAVCTYNLKLITL